MKIQHVAVVDGLSRVSDSEAANLERDFSSANDGAGGKYIRVSLRLKPYEAFSPGSQPRTAFLVEPLGGVDIVLLRENAKGIFIGQKLRICIDDEV